MLRVKKNCVSTGVSKPCSATIVSMVTFYTMNDALFLPRTHACALSAQPVVGAAHGPDMRHGRPYSFQAPLENINQEQLFTPTRHSDFLHRGLLCGRHSTGLVRLPVCLPVCPLVGQL